MISTVTNIIVNGEPSCVLATGKVTMIPAKYATMTNHNPYVVFDDLTARFNDLSARVQTLTIKVDQRPEFTKLDLLAFKVGIGGLLCIIAFLMVTNVWRELKRWRRV